MRAQCPESGEGRAEARAEPLRLTGKAVANSAEPVKPRKEARALRGVTLKIISVKGSYLFYNLTLPAMVASRGILSMTGLEVLAMILLKGLVQLNLIRDTLHVLGLVGLSIL